MIIGRRGARTAHRRANLVRPLKSIRRLETPLPFGVSIRRLETPLPFGVLCGLAHRLRHLPFANLL